MEPNDPAKRSGSLTDIIPPPLPMDEEQSQTTEHTNEAVKRVNSTPNLPLVAIDKPQDAEAQEEAELFDDEGHLLGIFNVKQPRDISNGFSHAVQNVGYGVAAGVGGLVSGPVMGYQDGGATGFFKGLGVGLIGAITAPAIGIGAGTAQIVRGFMAEGTARDAKKAGLVWNPHTREWIPEVAITLEELHANKQRELNAEKRRAAQTPGEAKNHEFSADVVDRSLYDILGVEPGPELTESDVKKAYYRKARESHPDKNPGDPNAEQTFKQISEAYQVLGDPLSRLSYDKNGKSDAPSSIDFDPGYLFSMVFGSESLSPFIGEEFRMSALLTQLLSGGAAEAMSQAEFDKNVDTETLDVKQAVRTVNMAIHLRDFIEPYVMVSKYTYLKEKSKKHPDKWLTAFNEVAANVPAKDAINVWIEDVEATGRKLCDETFGRLYVDALGIAYTNYSEQYRKDTNLFETMGARLASTYKNLSSTFTLFQVFLTLVQNTQKLQELQKQLENNQGNPDAMMKYGQEMVTLQEEVFSRILDFGLRLNLMDVDASVKEAVVHVCSHDTSIQKLERKLRADAIYELGSIFVRTASKVKKEGGEDTNTADIQRDLEQYIAKARQKQEEEE